MVLKIIVRETMAHDDHDYNAGIAVNEYADCNFPEGRTSILHQPLGFIFEINLLVHIPKLLSTRQRSAPHIDISGIFDEK